MTSIDAITNTDLANVNSATRLVGITTEVEGYTRALPHTVALCDDHAIARLQNRNLPVDARRVLDLLPQAVEDHERFCADCIRATGYTYIVMLTYYKPTGKFYAHGYYLTTKQHLFEVYEQVYGILRSGQNPGLKEDTIRRNDFKARIDVAGHPMAVSHLVTSL